ncbi:MAG: hypothetical protein R6W79_00660 [Acidimicrobiia bacterium]
MLVVAFAVAVFLAPVTAGPVDALPPDDGPVAYMASMSEHHPDGKIAILDGRGDIYLMESDGTGLLQLTDPWNSGGSVVLWSPDGLTLAFTSNGYYEEGDAGMYVTTLDGDARRVTPDGFGDGDSVAVPYSWSPSWSPDGAKILFVGWSDPGIYTADVATGTIELVVSPEPQIDEIQIGFESPTFSPDGSRIAYVKRTTAILASGTWPPRSRVLRSGAIFVADADGSNAVRITNSLAPPGSSTTYVDDDHSPVWSPDGTSLAFVSGSGVQGEVAAVLVVVNPDGSGRRVLTDGSDNVFLPAWSLDGRSIAWSGDSDSYVIDVDGSDLVVLGPGSSPSWSSNSSRIALNTAYNVVTVNRDGSGYTVLDPVGLPNDSNVLDHAWQPVFPPVGLVDSGQGRWHLKGWQGEMSSFYYGNPGDVPFMGDWDCDGVDTPGLYRQSDGYAYLRNSNTQGVADIKFFFGNPGDVPLAGDWDSDGCDTLSIYRPSEQVFYIINELGSEDSGLGAAEYSFMFGDPGDKPVVGDWDGDGIDEIGLHRESSGFFYWRDSLDTGVADGSIFFGDPGDRIVSGDWGPIPGRDTPGVYRPSNGFVYFRYTLTEGNADTWFPWPNATDTHVPVAGNFGLD